MLGLWGFIGPYFFEKKLAEISTDLRKIFRKLNIFQFIMASIACLFLTKVINVKFLREKIRQNLKANASELSFHPHKNVINRSFIFISNKRFEWKLFFLKIFTSSELARMALNYHSEPIEVGHGPCMILPI